MIELLKIKDFATVITGGTPSTTKNEYGITIVDAENAASSLIFKIKVFEAYVRK